MPSLILSSRYTTDSQTLRETAREMGWETLRLDGTEIPDWFDPPDAKIAMFYTAPHAFEIAAQLDRTLLGCPPDWTPKLPQRFLSRELYQTTLVEALQIDERRFVKHSVSKAFPATVYTADSLREATGRIQPDSLVHVGEPVEFEVEYRCFVLDREIVTISPYLRFGEAVAAGEHSMELEIECEHATAFAHSVLMSDEVRLSTRICVGCRPDPTTRLVGGRVQ